MPRIDPHRRQSVFHPSVQPARPRQHDLLIEPQEEKPYRVLIVNDDEQISEFYVTLLQHAGMEAMALSVPMKPFGSSFQFSP